MAEEKIEGVISELKKLSRIYWKIGLLLIFGLFFSGLAALLVFFWQFFLMVNLNYPIFLGDWTVLLLIQFGLQIIFWEFLLVGIPTLAISIGLFFYWWSKLPEDDKTDFLSSEPHIWRRWIERSIAALLAGVGVLGSGLILIIIVVMTGHLTVPISSWTIHYLLTIFIMTGVISVVLLGLPAVIIMFIYWYTKIYRGREYI